MELGKKPADDEAIEHAPFQPTLPRVNLLPSAVRQSIAMRKALRGFVALGIVLVLAFAGVWYLQSSTIATAEAALAEAQAESQEIEAKIAALAPVKAMFSEISGQQELVRKTMASQPQAAAVFAHLIDLGEVASGPGAPVDFTSVTVGYQGIPVPGGPVNACANPDPFGADITIGCVTFNATAGSRAQVADLLMRMETDPMFVGPYVDSTTVSTGTDPESDVVYFTGTAGLSVEALDQELSAEEIEAILTPPKPADDEEGEGQE